MSPTLNPDWGKPVTLEDRPILRAMNDRKPKYFKVNYNRYHLDLNTLFHKTLASEVQKGDLVMLGLQTRNPGNTLKYLRKYEKWILWLSEKFGKHGFELRRVTNRNIEYIYQSLPYLKNQGVVDFFIKDDQTAVYLLFE